MLQWAVRRRGGTEVESGSDGSDVGEIMNGYDKRGKKTWEDGRRSKLHDGVVRRDDLIS